MKNYNLRDRYKTSPHLHKQMLPASKWALPYKWKALFFLSFSLSKKKYKTWKTKSLKGIRLWLICISMKMVTVANCRVVSNWAFTKRTDVEEICWTQINVSRRHSFAICKNAQHQQFDSSMQSLFRCLVSQWWWWSSWAKGGGKVGKGGGGA